MGQSPCGVHAAQPANFSHSRLRSRSRSRSRDSGSRSLSPVSCSAAARYADDDKEGGEPYDNEQIIRDAEEAGAEQ